MDMLTEIDEEEEKKLQLNDLLKNLSENVHLLKYQQLTIDINEIIQKFKNINEIETKEIDTKRIIEEKDRNFIDHIESLKKKASEKKSDNLEEIVYK